MNLEAMKEQWSAHDALLERSIRIQINTLRASGPALRRLQWLLWWEIFTSAILVVLLGSFLADHITEVKYALPGAALHVSAIALLGFGIHQLVMLRTDYDAPVVQLQKRLETLRTYRIRATQVALLTGPLLWVPALLVFLKGVFGINPYEIFEMRWILGNIAFGLVFIPLMIGLARKVASRLEGATWFRRIVNDLAGKTMNDAVAFLADLDGLAR